LGTGLSGDKMPWKPWEEARGQSRLGMTGAPVMSNASHDRRTFGVSPAQHDPLAQNAGPQQGDRTGNGNQSGTGDFHERHRRSSRDVKSVQFWRHRVRLYYSGRWRTELWPQGHKRASGATGR
jgi:hypothetical protein